MSGGDLSFVILQVCIFGLACLNFALCCRLRYYQAMLNYYAAEIIAMRKLLEAWGMVMDRDDTPAGVQFLIREREGSGE